MASCPLLDNICRKYRFKDGMGPNVSWKEAFHSYLMLKIGLHLKEITADLMKIPFSEMCSYCKLHSSSINPLGMWNWKCLYDVNSFFLIFFFYYSFQKLHNWKKTSKKCWSSVCNRFQRMIFNFFFFSLSKTILIYILINAVYLFILYWILICT